MNDDELATRLRAVEGSEAPDPRFAERLYLELATELKLPSARAGTRVSARPRAPRGLALLAAALLLVVLAVAAAVVGSQLLPRPSLIVPPRDWSGFKGDPARRGEGSDGPRGSPVLRWRFQANGSVPDNVSVAGDLVYASSDDGVLHALDVATGEERWRYQADDPPLRGPMLSEGRVHVFDGAGTLHALDAHTGEVGWQATTMVSDPSDVTTGDGALFMGSGTGELVAIDAGDGTQRWRTSVSTSGPARAPAFADGTVYAGADGGVFVAVDASDGSIEWRFDTQVVSSGTAVVADGVAYASGSWPDGTGVLWALDAADGAERWRVEERLHAPAVSGGVAYAGSDGFGVHALDTATGERLWTYPVEGIARPVAVADEVVYVAADTERRVYALDARTGAERWHFDVDAAVQCCIAVGRAAVYVGTQLGGVYAIAGSDETGPPKD